MHQHRRERSLERVLASVSLGKIVMHSDFRMVRNSSIDSVRHASRLFAKVASRLRSSTSLTLQDLNSQSQGTTTTESLSLNMLILRTGIQLVKIFSLRHSQ